MHKLGKCARDSRRMALARGMSRKEKEEEPVTQSL